jgi:hypothetical protein
MPFNESTKLKVKQRAHFKCCLCHEAWASDVHHIEPESEGSPNTEDNAAPLCAGCHDLYGGNPDKRKFIKESRDFWYSRCEKKSPPDPEMIREINERLCNVATKEDLQKAVSYIGYKIQNIMSQSITPAEQFVQLSDITAVVSTAAISTAVISDVTVRPLKATCPKCNGTYYAGQRICPNCGCLLPY